MFGLPAFTVAAIFGVSAIWVIYTLVFFAKTRHWVKEDLDDAPAPLPSDASEKTGGTA